MKSPPPTKLSDVIASGILFLLKAKLGHRSMSCCKFTKNFDGLVQLAQLFTYNRYTPEIYDRNQFFH